MGCWPAASWSSAVKLDFQNLDFIRLLMKEECMMDGVFPFYREHT